jgi:thioredoxin 1
MNANLIKVDSIENLENLFAASHQAPVILFKHSTTCGISAGVLREVAAVDGDIHMIVLQTHRPLSNAIAERTGVRHESPQAIVIRNGVPVYSASHYDIEPGELQSYLAQIDA